jgi:hypothetical protein
MMRRRVIITSERSMSQVNDAEYRGEGRLSLSH